MGAVGSVSADKDFHAFRTAVLFRYEHELCLELNIAFYQKRYVNWKTDRLYGIAFNQFYQATQNDDETMVCNN